MTSYLGCVLFGLIFFILSAKSGGKLGTKMQDTIEWIHAWAPYSYIILAILLAAPLVSMHIMHSWPERKEPEDPMARYRNADDVVED
jgi:hypothetical protein